jgi:hypothetical protein
LRQQVVVGEGGAGEPRRFVGGVALRDQFAPAIVEVLR